MTSRTICVDVDLSEFDDDDLLVEIESRNLQANLPHNIDFDRIRHLIECKMIDQAKEEAWQMIEKTLQEKA